MPHIPLNLGDDLKETKPAPAGVYDLMITEASDGVSKNGKPQIVVSIGFETIPDTPNLRHYISLPAKDDDADKAKFKALLLKRFLILFNVPHTAEGFDVEAMAGAKAKAEVTQTEPDDSGNIYNRLQVPKFKDEPAGKGAAKPPKG